MLVRGINFWQGRIDFGYCQSRECYRQLCQPSSKSCALVANYRPSSARRESSSNRSGEARNDGSTTFYIMEGAMCQSKHSLVEMTVRVAREWKISALRRQRPHVRIVSGAP